MENGITYVGVDAHKKDLFVAMLVGDQTTPVTWQVANEPHAVRRFVRKLEREAPGPVRMCYEAGPGGYALQRQVTTPRVHCQVIAPALIPRKPGEHIKTNRRDARQLAALLRAGLLTEVRPPTLEEEAVRDLCRHPPDRIQAFRQGSSGNRTVGDRVTATVAKVRPARTREKRCCATRSYGVSPSRRRSA